MGRPIRTKYGQSRRQICAICYHAGRAARYDLAWLHSPDAVRAILMLYGRPDNSRTGYVWLVCLSALEFYLSRRHQNAIIRLATGLGNMIPGQSEVEVYLKWQNLKTNQTT